MLTAATNTFKRLTARLTRVPVVGVDIGSAAVKVAHLVQDGGAPVLAGYAVEKILAGALPETIAAALRQARATTAHAVLGLASPELVVKPFQVPVIPKKELASAMQLEAEQLILNGHTPNEVISDWHILASSSQSLRGVLAVVPKSLVQARLRIARAAKLQPVVVDVEGLAAWNAYWTLAGHAHPPGRTVLLANVGARTTNVVVARGPDELVLLRDLQLGALAMAQGQGTEWAGELGDSLTYARTAGGMRTLDAVVLTGGGATDALPLVQTMASVPISLWNPLEQVGPEGLPGEPPPQDGFQLTVAIGLALRTPT
jgi:Tfp pilus assembly PilM family ATPase